MNFKDEYQKSFSEIKADENFKKNLVAQMNMEKKRKKKPSYMGVLVAAAVMVLVVGAGFMTGILRGKSNPGTTPDGNQMAQDTSDSQDNISLDLNNEMVAGQDMSESYVELNFSGLSWYGEAESNEELLTIFVSYMTGDTLDKIYCTDAENFDEQDLMSEADAAELVERLQNAECTEDEYTGEDMYYKAVFEDGLTIKFWLSDKGYLKLQDTKAVYKMQ